ncbi:hypothetical protein [Hahella ganghwensis]|uniref:capsular polysaccharide export protein, LipB/KpsS family n=1 Tax=Hahella ganghwensis TaxID=286420 RepID=UPI0009FF60DA|nr:hypothetical protein [Hahella ganghwensis]
MQPLVNRCVEWIIPIRGDVGELLLFSACDSKYFEYASSLIRSVDLYSPGFVFCLHLINPSEKVVRDVKMLADELLHTRLAVSIEKTDLSTYSDGEKVTYYACARFPQVARLLEEVDVKSILSLDSDSLIVNPIDNDFSDKPLAEVVLIIRQKESNSQPHLAVATGSIWFNCSDRVKAFAKSVGAELDALLVGRKLSWFADQIVFYQQMDIYRERMRFYNLKGKYADWKFGNDSIVWSGKGARKESDMRFFILQSLLSNSEKRRELALQLLEVLSSEYISESSENSWTDSRIEPARARCIQKKEKVCLLIPRLDMPWKRLAVGQQIPLLQEDALQLRLYWREFVTRLANVLQAQGYTVDITELPAWEITREKVDAMNYSIAFIPHRCHKNFEAGKTQVYFYMQEFYRWVFVVDQHGWSASSSVYPINIDLLADSDSRAFEIYRALLSSNKLDSKFSQKQRKTIEQLIADYELPICSDAIGTKKEVAPFIFFPLQIPHDQSIEYFSDIDEIELVSCLVEWARSHKVNLVLKPHPANRKAMEVFRTLVDNTSIYWSEAHIHDLISNCTAVFTINSGVGFEALMHVKPVVTFGRVEYDCVSFNATKESINEAWKYCNEVRAEDLEVRYRKFVNWFLDDYAVDMSRSDQAMQRIGGIVTGLKSRQNAALEAQV